MEILHGIVVIVVAAAAVLAFGLCLFIFYFLVQAIWPIMIGALGGYLIWKDFDQDMGILFGVVFIVVQLWWRVHNRKGLHPPVEDPKVKNKEKFVRELYFPGQYDY